ncbi:MAG: hypothetical protein R3336_01140 [Phycisphaeraceae bacterium]|nr:hypothetical protein [Phycisphaeraceae bacterium]
MSIEVQCSCGVKLKAPDELGGRSARCPSCRKPIFLPKVRDDKPMFRVNCPDCGMRIKAPIEWAGLEGNCPKCKNIVQMPSIEEVYSSQEAMIDEIYNELGGADDSIMVVSSEGVGEARAKTGDAPSGDTQVIPDDEMAEKAASDETEPNILIEPEAEEDSPPAEPMIPPDAGGSGLLHEVRKPKKKGAGGRLRALIHRSPSFSSAVAALMLIAATASFLINLGFIGVEEEEGFASNERGSFFFDLEDRRLLVMSSDTIPPVKQEMKEGDVHRLVKAYIFSCTGCDNVGVDDIDWLESFTPEGRVMMERFHRAMTDGKVTPEMVELEKKAWSERVVTTVSEIEQKWYSATGPAGIEILRLGRLPCPNGRRPVRCYP